MRARTTAAAVIALLAVLVVAGVAGVWFQRADLTAGVASLAEDQARTIAADLPESPAGRVPGSEESSVQVIALDTGKVVARSDEAGSTPLVPAPPTTAPAHRSVSDPVPDEPDRYEAVALRSADGTSYVVVARSLESVDAATASTSFLLLVGGLLVVLMTAGLTWRATGRALSPVEAMRSQAAAISAENLSNRLQVPPGRDELNRLATTLNELLGRIDESTRKERQFVADASHELRSPLATIRALLESDRISPHPGGRSGLTDEVLIETDRLTILVNDLLVLARGDARLPVQAHPVDLTALLTTEAQRARAISVSTRLAPRAVVNGDAGLLRVAVRNLLDNAEHAADQRVMLASVVEGDHVIVTVADDGPGVPAADRERIFERFVRLDDGRARDEGGTGLGLAITRQIAELHGGHVAVDAPPSTQRSVGARFMLVLPSLTPDRETCR